MKCSHNPCATYNAVEVKTISKNTPTQGKYFSDEGNISTNYRIDQNTEVSSVNSIGMFSHTEFNIGYNIVVVGNFPCIIKHLVLISFFLKKGKQMSMLNPSPQNISLSNSWLISLVLRSSRKITMELT